jgi:putative membrane protein
MILESTRSHWASIFMSIYNHILNNLIFIILFSKWLDINTFIIAILTIGIDIIVSTLDWRNSIFYINDNILFIENGVLKKSKKELPLDKISAVDTKASFFNSLLDVSVLSVNTGAIGASNSSEFKFLLKNDSIEHIKNILLDKDIKENSQAFDIKEIELIEGINYKEKCIYKVSLKEILKYTLTKSKIYFILAIGFIFDKLDYVFDFDKINKYMEKYNNNIVDIGNEVFNYSVLTIVSIAILALILIYIIASTVCFILDYIKYYEFTLCRENNSISIEYGLINKSKFNFKLEQINYLKLKQNLVCQILGLYNIEISVIGYGASTESKTKAILYPIANLKLKDEIIKNVLKEFDFNKEFHRPCKQYIHMFFIKRYVITLGLVLSIAYLDNFTGFNEYVYLLILVSILGIQTMLGYMTYKNNLIGIDDYNILLSNGSIRKKIITIPKNKVQSIAYKQSVFQRNKNICNYNIDTYSDDLGEIIKVKNIERKLVSTLEKELV